MKTSLTNSNVHYRTCCLCEAMCGLEIEHSQFDILSIKPDKADPFSKGHICPKAVALQDIHYDPDRLREPLRKTAEGWEVISWEQALDEAAKKLKVAQEKYGADAVATYMGNPNAHHYGTLLFVDRLIKAIGSRNRFSVASVDHLPHALACTLLFGNQLFFPVPDIDRTDFLLCLGANPVVSGGSLMGAPSFSKRIKRLQERGGELVVVDPRRTETALIASEHLFIRPAGDVWLLLGMINVLFEKQLVNLGNTASYIDGIEPFKQRISRFSVEQCSEQSAITTGNIESLAVRFASAKTAIAYGRVGSCTQVNGTLTGWLIYLLNILTGNFDRVGGIMFPEPAIDLAKLAELSGYAGSFDCSRSRVRGLPEFAGEFPAATMADEMLTAGKGQVKALLTLAGNPVLSTPNGRKLDRALKGLDFMVSIDFYLNETTRHADIILPPTGPLEHPHYSLGVHAVATRNSAKYSPALFESDANSRHDWQIILGLASRLETGSVSKRIKSEISKFIFDKLGPDGLLNLLLRMGAYGSFNPFSNRLSLNRLKKAPHGIDLGRLKPVLPDKLFTDNKRIQLLHAVYDKGLEGLGQSAQKEANSGFDLLMIGRRSTRSNNSWMHNSQRLVKGKERCTLLIHPVDAVQRAIEEGDRVTVSSCVGSVQIKVEVTDSIMKGVVSMPHGWGHNREGSRLPIAKKKAGVSMNDLTDEQFVDPLTGIAALNGLPVKVESTAPNVILDCSNQE
jgi:anaerobic selenocysteine-containing dehydrogenase